MSNEYKAIFAHWRQDIPASIVVFLIALPLCLGIALASGAPLYSGLISGIVGGIVVGLLSQSSLSVSGPAAGLALVTLNALEVLPSYSVFLLAVVLAGLMQIGLGLARLGTLSHFVPTAVVKGMLTAIGIVLILKQIPHALGDDRDYEGDEAFWQADGYNTFTELWSLSEQNLSMGAAAVAIISLVFLFWWEKDRLNASSWKSLLPGPLLVAAFGVLAVYVLPAISPALAISDMHRVRVPVIRSFEELSHQFILPDFGMWANFEVWKFAFILCMIASIESLLSIEAIDKLDPRRRITPHNRELVAQGVGNIVSGMMGGLPVVSVIVRSSANMTAGARTRLSVIVQGVLLLLVTFSIPTVINLIPLSSLAAILIFVGYQLAKPEIFVRKYQKGMAHFLPFMATILAIIFTDVFTGVMIGMLVGLLFVIKGNYRSAVSLYNDGSNYLLRFKKDLSFIHKYELKRQLATIPAGSFVLIDLSKIGFVDMDNAEIINDFIIAAKQLNMEVKVKRSAFQPHFMIQEPTQYETI